MLQTNSVWIVENQRQRESLNTLRSKLRFKSVVLEKECDITSLPSYDIVCFLLVPSQIGNRFFLEAIAEILNVRRNAKTIFFAIDACDQLDAQELVKVRLELNESVRSYIPDPVVFAVSSFYAAVYHSYSHGDLSLYEVQQNREFLISAPEGLLSGRRISPQHMELLPELSGMDRLAERLEQVSFGIHDSGIDVTRKNWLVIGSRGAGASTVTRMLQSSRAASNAVRFTDAGAEGTPDPEDVRAYYDGMVVVIDPGAILKPSYLEKICSLYPELEKVFVVNQFDRFMYYGLEPQALRSELTRVVREYTSEAVFFVSAYYYEEWDRLQSGEITVQDVIRNPEIVLIDSLAFPIAKPEVPLTLPELLHASSGFDDLLHTWE
ncbi:hypothetical protein D3P08_06170 [Paenibacillus nanensis]|uniref:Uncharacterized protein n=1 Tax=Paenibacillus nanensis TaxID=393251 RepID=A0A3A1VFM0_9BACL|nr:hypothetical protein [Paenibacillus nanensis]RIX59709.1 hypothetical protein D3P08_06170 [Paenibacillus nanensis]